MGGQVEELARFVATTRLEDIPAQVRDHARLVFLDTLGVILAGAERPEVAALRRQLCASTHAGATLYARGWQKSDPRSAALLNGIAGRAIELCAETFGIGQLVYGSDTPVVDSRPTLDAVRGFGDAVTHVLQSDTPSRLLT